MKKFKVVGKILFILNLLAATSLLLAYSSPYVSPQSFWPIAFFGLAFPYLLLLNVLFLLYWMFKGSSKLFISLLVIILGYKNIPSYAQFRFNKSEVNEDALKVVSFNVRVFDLYMWSKEKTTRNKIFDFLKKEDPDILCLQEFYHSEDYEHYEFKTLDTLIQFLKTENYHAHYTTTLRKTDHWGIITLSKHPILKRGKVPFKIEDDNVCIYTDIKKGEDTIRVYNAHLASIKLDKHDYKAMQNVNKNDYSKDFDKEIMVLNKIKYGFKRRASQADSIAKSINESPHPVILCGDFNDTPSSYAYQTIKGNLKDAFMESGSGLGRTYIGEFPSFRIDYIFMDQHFQSMNYQTHSEKLSDHHPISVYIQTEQ